MAAVKHPKLRVCLADLCRVFLAWLLAAGVVCLLDVGDRQLWGHTYLSLLGYALLSTFALAVALLFLDCVLSGAASKPDGKSARHPSTDIHITYINNEGKIDQLSTGRGASQIINDKL